MSGSRQREEELDRTLDEVQALVAGDLRREAVDALLRGTDGAGALRRLRSALRDHAPAGPGSSGNLVRLVRKLDNRTRAEGFRVLHSWNHRLHAFTEDSTPVLMLDYYTRARGDEDAGRVPAEILLDYYLLHLLALCAMRAWDAAEPDAVLDRVTALLAELHGDGGSGHRFVADSETAIIYALSQFHPEEHAYDRVIERMRGLRPERRVRFAAASAAVLSAHLRWGFWLMYGRDVVRMRADNVGDYPWLLFSIETLLDAWVDAPEGAPDADRDRVLGALLQGLAADPWAFTGRPPGPLEALAPAHGKVRGLLAGAGTTLVDALETHRPSKAAYAPLALHFNFPHNALVAMVAMALLESQPSEVSLNRLFEREAARESGEMAPTERVARALTAYAGATPDRLGTRGARLVAYDPLSGLRSFTMTTDALNELTS